VYGIGSCGIPLKQRGCLLLPIIKRGRLSVPSIFTATNAVMRSLVFLLPLSASVENVSVPSGKAR
jgi:hypothetical protein